MKITNRNLSFRGFLTMAALIILLPFHVLIGILLWDKTELHNRRVEAELHAVTRMAAAVIDADLREWLAELQPLAFRVASTPTASPRLRDMLTTHLEGHPATHAVAVVDADRAIVAQAGKPDSGSIEPLFRAIPHPTRGAEVHSEVSGLLADPTDGTALIGIAIRSGSLSDVTVMELQRLDFISLILAEEDKVLGWKVAIVDQDDKVVAASDRAMVGKPFVPRLPPRFLGSTAPVQRVLADGVDMYLAVVAATAAQWRVVSLAPAQALDEGSRPELFGLLMLGGLLVLPVTASVLLGCYLGRRVELLADAAHAVSSDVMPKTMRRERAKARERMQDMKEALNRAQRMESIGQVMAGVAHDFGNLIFTISGNLALLRRCFDEQAPEQLLIEPSLCMTEEAMRLISQLLAGARQTRRDVRLVNVNADLAEIIDLLRHVAGPSVVVTTQLDHDLLNCRLDPTLLRSALLNLVVNAREAMPRGGEIRIATGNVLLDESAAAAKGLDTGPYVTVSVRDNGVGIPSDVLSQIFQPFFTTRENEGGTGFGLSTLYGFVTAAGGCVGVDSVLGEGTTFTLHLPGKRGEQSNPSILPAAECCEDAQSHGASSQQDLITRASG
jgi:signal transduction histidine kinase